jgi:hypothetical protein
VVAWQTAGVPVLQWRPRIPPCTRA